MSIRRLSASFWSSRTARPDVRLAVAVADHVRRVRRSDKSARFPAWEARLQHLERLVHRHRAIVEAGQNVSMDVNHWAAANVPV